MTQDRTHNTVIGVDTLVMLMVVVMVSLLRARNILFL